MFLDLYSLFSFCSVLTISSLCQASDSDSQKKFPSKSCSLRYGTAKIQEDALSLFQAALREYLGLFTAKIQGSQNNQWGITSLSISASKIVPIPSVSYTIT